MLLGLVLTLAASAVSPAAAAPPDSAGESDSPVDAATDSRSDLGDRNLESQLVSVPQPEPDGEPDAESAPENGSQSSGDSVRARGHEAPVELRQDRDQSDDPVTAPEDEPAKEVRDPGDGPMARRDKPAKQDDRATLPSRVWPMPTESYTLTQDFGCTQQLGNLYFPGEGCPAGAPVIHTGLDMAAPEGTPFYAAASGWVTLADYDRPTADANTRIIIQHDGRNEGYATDYLHWIASYVEKGDYVRAGDPIGEVGSVGFSTGAHLHFSVTDLQTGEFTDPMRWLPKGSGPSDYSRSESRAKLRLPPGTTAGQPESADPSPPEPPVRVDVPESPPDERGSSRDRATRNGNGQKKDRGARKSEDAAATDTRGSRKDRAATDAPAESSATDATVEEGPTTQRDRRRERNKNGVSDETVDSGTDGTEPVTSDDTSSTKSKRDRKSGGGSGGGGKKQDQNGNQGGGGKGNGSGGGGGGNGNGNGKGNGKDAKHGGGGSGGKDGGNSQNGAENGTGNGAGSGNGGTGNDGNTDGGEGNGTDGAPGGDSGNGDEGSGSEGDGGSGEGEDGSGSGSSGDPGSDPGSDTRGGDSGGGESGGVENDAGIASDSVVDEITSE